MVAILSHEETRMSTPTTAANCCYLTGDGPTLSYLAAGDAARRPVLFLHGLSSPSTSWTPAMEHLGCRWRTFALDLRGHGRSDHTPSRYRLADYCADVDRLLVRSVSRPSSSGTRSARW
jgi:pimeloyl-ACP methyl ester carboxylesterase